MQAAGRGPKPARTEERKTRRGKEHLSEVQSRFSGNEILPEEGEEEEEAAPAAPAALWFPREFILYLFC